MRALQTLGLMLLLYGAASASSMHLPGEAMARSSENQTAVSEAYTTPEVTYDETYSVDVPTKTSAGRIKPQSLQACSPNDLEKKLCSPILIRMIELQCTDEARQSELTGELVVGFVVNSRGLTEDARVLQSLGKGLDDKAVDTVRQWKFRPAVYKGEPFPVHARLTMEFACRKSR